jgi:hypothetical protein
MMIRGDVSRPPRESADVHPGDHVDYALISAALLGEGGIEIQHAGFHRTPPRPDGRVDWYRRVGGLENRPFRMTFTAFGENVAPVDFELTAGGRIRPIVQVLTEGRPITDWHALERDLASLRTEHSQASIIFAADYLRPQAQRVLTAFQAAGWNAWMHPGAFEARGYGGFGMRHDGIAVSGVDPVIVRRVASGLITQGFDRVYEVNDEPQMTSDNPKWERHRQSIRVLFGHPRP